MPKDPIDAYLGNDAPLPIPDDASARIQARMFGALDEEANASFPADGEHLESGEADIPGDVDVVVKLDDHPAAWRWSGPARRLAAAAAVVAIAGAGWVVVRSSPQPDAATDRDPTPVTSGNGVALLDEWCATSLPLVEDWNPPIGSIADTQLPEAEEAIAPVLVDLVHAMAAVDEGGDDWQAARDEVNEIDAQYRAELVASNIGSAIHILPLVVRRMQALADDLADLGVDACATQEP